MCVGGVGGGGGVTILCDVIHNTISHISLYMYT